MRNYCVEDFNECATICAIEMDKEKYYLAFHQNSKIVIEHDRYSAYL